MRVTTSVVAVAISTALAGLAPLVVAAPAAGAVGTASAARVATVGTSPQRPVDLDLRPARPGVTRTSLTVTPRTGPAYQSVTLSVAVAASAPVTGGTVTITDGTSLVASSIALDHGVASVTTNALGAGTHLLVAVYSGTSDASPSSSAPVSAAYGGEDSVGAQSVVVTIPSGSLTITTPYAAGRPVDLGRADLDQSTSTYAAGARIDRIVITDTRSGNQGFTASVSASRFVSSDGGSFAASRAGLVDLAADQVPGNALRASLVQVVDTRPGAPGLGSSRVFARYPAGLSLGTVRIHGTLAVTGVPSSITSGRYVARLTFTAI
ncbi:MAG TPA: Ig-like domain-containing protein [Cellulomonas sp.]|uniref:Ig-like domain-containing protein n=1 Tax=Cellulomonas sp. TaxID=40001 RepID=UPI002E34AE43|nr:Ig-like domain-containing protein [Cellulomonas sp.]HEX5332914.1 Ig-like domain-containing protein [Cellulomonas sp.]